MSAAQPTLAVHHGPASASAVSEANGVGALFGLAAPLAVGATVAAGWGWRPAVAATALLVVLACVLTGRLPARGALGRPEPVLLDLPVDPEVDPRAGATVDARDDARGDATAPGVTGSAPPRGRARFSRAYWYFWWAMLAAIAVENTTTFWVADLVGQRTGAGPGIATAALAGLVAGMALTRFTLPRLLRRRSSETLLVGAFLFAAVGWALVWTATTTPVALAGLVVAGLGYGAQYPLAITAVLRASSGRPDQAQASASLGLGLAVGIAPFLLGAIADRVGTHAAFLVVPVFLAVGATAVLLGRRAASRAVA
jgi:predicted MFS family arabinose efflux permease